MVQIRKETVSIWDYKIDNNVNIANFECLWKTRIRKDLCLNPACEVATISTEWNV